MKVKVLTEGSYSGMPYSAGDELTGDSDHLRELLVNGLAEPLDEPASAFLARTQDHEPYVKASYQAIKSELDANPPAPPAPSDPV